MDSKNVLIIYAHPESKSMNGAMFQKAVNTFQENGHKVVTTDLYRQAFNPTSGRNNFRSTKDPEFFKQQAEESYASSVSGFAPEIEDEIRKVEQCDLMILQFPLWWFSVPAILKGWIDRVFAMGRAYGGGRIYDNGVFVGKKAFLSLTIGGGPGDYVPDGRNGDLTGILRPLHRGVLEFTGFSVLQPHVIYSPARKSREQLQHELELYSQRLINIWEEPYFNVGRY